MRSLAFVVSLTVAVSTAAAQETRPFTIDTMWDIQRVGAPAVSPDGTHVAYTVTTYVDRAHCRWDAAPCDDQPGVGQRAGLESRRQAPGVCLDWILKPQNSKHWYGEVLGWLGKYLRRA